MNDIEKAIDYFDGYGSPYDDLILTALREKVENDKLKAEGRLVVLPCKIGDKVWLLVRGGIELWEVYAIQQSEVGTWSMRLRNNMLSQRRPTEFEVLVRAFSSVGKTVFLTKEDAEKALEERSGG